MPNITFMMLQPSKLAPDESQGSDPISTAVAYYTLYILVLLVSVIKRQKPKYRLLLVREIESSCVRQ